MTTPSDTYETVAVDSRVGAVQSEMIRLRHEVEQLDVHISDLRSRLAMVLRPAEPEPDTALLATAPKDGRSPSEHAIFLGQTADIVNRLRGDIVGIFDRVDV